MIYTLKKQKPKRKYNRTKLTKGEVRATRKAIAYFLIALTVGLSIYATVSAKNEYRLEVREVEVEKIIIVEEVKDVSVEQQIRNIAKEMDFQWTDYLVKLANCESSLNPLAINTGNNHPVDSIDRGLFMINDYWHAEISDECSFDLRCSTEFAINLINQGRQYEWVCNKKI